MQTLEYDGPYDENLECPICRSPLVEPVTIRCGHVFCRGCITESLQYSVNCPIDRIRIISRSSGRDTVILKGVPLIIRNQLDNLKVQCPNVRCSHVCARSFIEVHYDRDCPFTKVLCPDGACDQLVSRCESEGQCLHDAVDCIFCGRTVDFASLQDHHHADCLQREVTCEHCTMIVPQSSINDHVAVCVARKLCCKFQPIGCAFKDTKEKLSDHERSCLYGVVLRMDHAHRAEMDGMKDRLRDTQDHVRRLEAERAMALARRYSPLPSQARRRDRHGAAPDDDSPGRSPLPLATTAEEKVHYALSILAAFDMKLKNLERHLGDLEGRFVNVVTNDIGPIQDQTLELRGSVHHLGLRLQRWMLQTADRSSAVFFERQCTGSASTTPGARTALMARKAVQVRPPTRAAARRSRRHPPAAQATARIPDSD